MTGILEKGVRVIAAHPLPNSLPCRRVILPPKVVAVHEDCASNQEVVVEPVTFLCAEHAQATGFFARRGGRAASPASVEWYAWTDDTVWRMHGGAWTNTQQTFDAFWSALVAEHDAHNARAAEARWREKCVDGVHTPSPEKRRHTRPMHTYPDD